MADDWGFGGDRMTITEDAAGTATITFDDKGTGRDCGSCTLCCKLIPVPGPPLFKKAGERCRHQSHAKGCRIYATRPRPCRAWSCRWLADPTTKGLPRPDRCHYVIDLQYDEITIRPEDGSAAQGVPVVQVWVDPAYRDAHRAPELRAYMLRMATEYGIATVVRFAADESLTIFPPPLNREGRWHEQMAVTVPKLDRALLDRPSPFGVTSVSGRSREAANETRGTP